MTVGDRTAPVPRHREVRDLLARLILEQLDLEEDS